MAQVAGITIRHPRASDEDVFLAAVERSRALHRPWVQPPATPAAVRRLLSRPPDKTHVTFLIIYGGHASHGAGDLVGVVNVSEIVRGSFKSAYLGYYAFEPFAGTGLMRAGMAKVIAQAFRQMKLHRLEANIQPGNQRSIGLAKALGFRLEGFSPRYLKVGGRWRDHERWALLAND